MTTSVWSPLLVIRPDRSGDAFLDDASGHVCEVVPRTKLLGQILGSTAELGSRPQGSFDNWVKRDEVEEPGGLRTGTAPTSVRKDWIAKGWRPSLEYFEWSEWTVDGYESSVVDDPVIAPAETGTVWEWSGLDDGNPARQAVAEEVLLGRRTRRVFDSVPLEREVLAGVLKDFSRFLSTEDASEGFLAAIETFAIFYAVEGLTPGVWSLTIGEELAALRSPGDFRTDMSDLMCGMQAAMTAPVTIVLVADFPRRQRRFPYERALRELYVEVGRIAQWFILACEMRGLGCLITPATNDQVLTELLLLTGDRAPIYTITFGRRRPKPHSSDR